jgi:hypothetical protein
MFRASPGSMVRGPPAIIQAASEVSLFIGAVLLW